MKNNKLINKIQKLNFKHRNIDYEFRQFENKRLIRECEIEKNKRLRVHKFWEGEMGFYKKNFEEKILKKLIWSGWVELFNFLDFFFGCF